MRIVVGISGGIDSAYTALMLKEQGHEVEGVILRMHAYSETDDAQKVAEKVGIPLTELDCTRQFEERVVEPFIREYPRGRTPNPCVVCNRYLKIALLCEYAEKNGFDKAATGHYARLGYENGRYFVAAADDLRKDQSYVLWHLTQKQLSRLIFPLYGKDKQVIKAEAEKLGLADISAKKESQEICFIPDNNHAAFIEERLGKFPEGDFILPDGKVVGKHKGIIRYTVGQRRGLGIAMGERYFVTDIDPENNTVTVAPAGGDLASSARISGLNFQYLDPALAEEGSEIRLSVKIRYGAAPRHARVIFGKDSAEVFFEEQVRAVTPGQSAVFYSDGKVAFGGFIDK